MTTATRTAPAPGGLEGWAPLPFPGAEGTPATSWWLTLLGRALLSRAMDELELSEGYKPNLKNPDAGRLKFQFSAKGHEISQLVAAALLNHPHDAATVYYRSRPLILGIGLSPFEAFASVMHKLEGVSGGRDIGVVFNHRQPDGVTVLPSSGDVGAQYTPAIGWAQALRYRVTELKQQEYDGAVALVHGGDGSTATNGFWSALNIAAPFRYPLVLLIEDNGYALTVPSRYQSSGSTVVDNLRGFKGLGWHSTDAWEPAELFSTMRTAIAAARTTQEPQLIHVRTPRLSGHNWQDNAAYKTAEERDTDLQRDPLPALISYLQTEHGVSAKQIGAMELEARAFARAEGDRAWFEGHDPQPEDALTHIFAPTQPIDSGEPLRSGARVTVQRAINMTLADELRRDPTIVVFGEDVGRVGGVHRVTDGLQLQFGEGRVFDTNINEEGIMGRSIGMALAGLRPVPELQFRKYADPAHEQISDMGSMRWRTNGRFGGPVVLRIPVGYQKMGGDPWHAVTGEAVFAHLPGWKIAYPSNAVDAAGLLRTSLRGDDPVFFLEHRLLYDYMSANEPYPGPDFQLPFGKARTVRSGRHALVITWGVGVYDALDAARELAAEGKEVEILDLRTLIPLDHDAVMEAVKRIGKVLIVHEDTITCGFGAELAAQIADEAFEYLDGPIRRLAAADVPAPCHKNLFSVVEPNSRKVKQALDKLIGY